MSPFGRGKPFEAGPELFRHVKSRSSDFSEIFPERRKACHGLMIVPMDKVTKWNVCIRCMRRKSARTVSEERESGVPQGGPPLRVPPTTPPINRFFQLHFTSLLTISVFYQSYSRQFIQLPFIHAFFS